MRYVRDHSQFEADLVARQDQSGNEEQQRAREAGGSQEKRGRVGFNKRLLKDSKGLEQSFEEARASAKCYKLAPPSVNFNLMQVHRADQSSQMDLDDEVSSDTSMSGALSSSGESPLNNEQPRKLQRLDSNLEGRVLFESEPNIENSLNHTAVSTASSVVNEADAVGVSTRKEEETINTKLAMRELSMMFSSPAFGVDEVAERTRQQTAPSSLDRSVGPTGPDTSFANVGDGLGTSMLDNSILNFDETVAENRGPRNPLPRSTHTPGFEKMALRELKSTAGTEGSLSCRYQRSVEAQEQPQDDPLRGPEIDMVENPGFQIYEDEEAQQTLAPSGAFSIFEDGVENDQDSDGVPSQDASRIFQDPNDNENRKPSASIGFTIHEDSDEDNESERSDPYAHGNTATFSLLGDALGHDDEDDANTASSPMQSSPEAADEQGDTADLSLFNELFQTQSSNEKSKGQDTEGTRGFSIFMDGEENESSVS